MQLLSCVQFFATPWTVVRQAPLAMGFSKEEYWSGLPSPPPGDLSNPGIYPRSPALQADSLPSELPGKPKNKLYFNLKKRDTCSPMFITAIFILLGFIFILLGFS